MKYEPVLSPILFCILTYDKIFYIRKFKVYQGKTMHYILSAAIRGAIPFIIMKLQHIDDYSVNSTFITGLIITAVAATSVIYDVKS